MDELLDNQYTLFFSKRKKWHFQKVKYKGVLDVLIPITLMTHASSWLWLFQNMLYARTPDLIFSNEKSENGR